MPTNATELAAAVSTAAGFVSKRNASTLLERIAALTAGGEAEERILARLNGPARIGVVTDEATPSRGSGGLTDVERQRRMEHARRTTVEELAGAVADRLDVRLADRLDRVDVALRIGLERLAGTAPITVDQHPQLDGRAIARTVAGMTTTEQMAANPATSAIAAANAAAATTHDDTVPWETRPAADRLPVRETQRHVLRLLAATPMTVHELAVAVGLGTAGAQSRLVHLHGSGHVQRRLVAGRYVYRVHPAIAELVA